MCTSRGQVSQRTSGLLPVRLCPCECPPPQLWILGQFQGDSRKSSRRGLGHPPRQFQKRSRGVSQLRRVTLEQFQKCSRRAPEIGPRITPVKLQDSSQVVPGELPGQVLQTVLGDFLRSFRRLPGGLQDSSWKAPEEFQWNYWSSSRTGV